MEPKGKKTKLFVLCAYLYIFSSQAHLVHDLTFVWVNWLVLKVT
jgi:hypothetical protein